MTYPLLNTLNEQPLLIEQGGLSQFLANIAPRADRALGERNQIDFSSYKIQDTVGIISVTGTLIDMGDTSRYNFCTSYEDIRDQLRKLSADVTVKRGVLLINSGGGMVSGVDTAAEAILAARKIKPITAIVYGACCSAAYWLASQCDQIIISSQSMVGSIGAVITHLDYTTMFENSGVKATLITSGTQKASTSPYKALTPEAKAELQKMVNTIGHDFAAAVAANRKNLTKDELIALQARVYMAEEAVSLGLADKIGTIDTFLGGFKATLQKPSPPSSPTTTGNYVMDSTITKAEHDTAIAAARAEGATAALARIQMIYDSKECFNNREMAMAMAFEMPEASTQAIFKIIAKTPVIKVEGIAPLSTAEISQAAADAFIKRTADAGANFVPPAADQNMTADETKKADVKAGVDRMMAQTPAKGAI